MADILITVSGQSMVFTSMPVIASHGVNEDYVEFTFDATWSGYAKTATFWHERTPETIYTTIVNGSNRALVPHEVTETAGRIFIGVTGTQGNIKLTSEVLPYPILPGSDDDGVNSEDITPDMLDQILSAMAEMVGTPLTANTAADMTDTTRIYVYTGSEPGYVNGSWYYYNGSSWVVGGVYNSQGISNAFYNDIADLVKQSAVANESDSAPYLFRPTPNPSAILADEEIVGGTVAWNQLQGQTTSRTNAGITYTYNSTDGTLRVAGTASAASYWESGSTGFKQDYFANHVYLLLAGNDSYAGSGSTYRLYFAQTAFSPRYADTPVTMAKPNASGNNYLLQVAVYSGTTVDITLRPQLFDLTAMLGSTIADYLYTLESGTPGAGVAKLREWGFLSKDYFAYDAGSLVSVNTEGKEVVGANECYHEPGTAYNIYNGGHLIPVKAGEKIYVYGEWTYTSSASMWGGIFATPTETNKNNKLVQLSNFTAGSVKTYDITTDGYFGVAFNAGVNTYDVTKMMISRINTTYQPYRSTTYPTTPTDLNGIFKLDANNNLYADGDRYKADGTITRIYHADVIDGGANLTVTSVPQHSSGNYYCVISIPSAYTAANNTNLFNDGGYSAASGVVPGHIYEAGSGSMIVVVLLDQTITTPAAANAYFASHPLHIVYELASAKQTTDTANTYAATQIVGKGGTERWIDQRSVPVPVGHRTTYSIGVPDVPSNANNATLHATVSGGRTTLTWS